MYKLNKRNVKRDEKAKGYLEKTMRSILEAENMELPEKTAKDHKTELIMQIFKEEEEEDDFNQSRP